MNYIKIFYFFVALLTTSTSSFATDPIVGVYYFPGWASSHSTDPWKPIKSYPERKPLLGWYKEEDISVAKQHYKWWQQYGIDLVIFDWYWSNAPEYDHAVNNFKTVGKDGSVNYALLLANHHTLPKSIDDFDKMISHLTSQHFGSPTYFKIDGAPVLIIFSPSEFEKSAAQLGLSSKILLRRANVIAQAEGFPRVHFVAVSHAIDDAVNKVLPDMGYLGTTSYNYHFGLAGSYNPHSPPTEFHSFEELITGYKTTWSWFFSKTKYEHWPVLSSGWDRRPWGGSSDVLHDNSFGTPTLFRKHVSELAPFLNKRSSFGRVVMICCWNEFGEGSFIEPTLLHGTDYLESIEVIAK